MRRNLENYAPSDLPLPRDPRVALESGDAEPGSRSSLDETVAFVGATHVDGEFVAHLSHEIRTPMSAILGYADLLANRPLADEDRDAVDIIRKNCHYILELVNDALEMSKTASPHRPVVTAKVAIAQVFSEVSDLMSVKARAKGLRLAVDFIGTLPTHIETQPRYFRQVLINLIGNAIKFTMRGSITLRVSLREQRDSTPTLRVSVTDTGIGICPSKHRRVFQAFEQAHDPSLHDVEGSGLGLALCRKLVEELRGTISLESFLGFGSTFTLEIPVGELTGVPRARLTMIREESPAPSGVCWPRLDARVLVVDDHIDTLSLTGGALENAGAEVECATNARSALSAMEYSRRLGQAFDAVVLDMRMSGIDGFELTRRLRTLGYELPILAHTASARSGDRDACIAAGCSDYLAKPTDGATLVAAVARTIRRHAIDARGGSPKVLTIDDSNDAANALSALLVDEGYRVEVAKDGHEALECARRFRPDVILMDIQIPHGPGDRIAKVLRDEATFRRTVIVALSGYSLDAATVADAGFDGAMLKPADFSALLDLLDSFGITARRP